MQLKLFNNTFVYNLVYTVNFCTDVLYYVLFYG